MFVSCSKRTLLRARRGGGGASGARASLVVVLSPYPAADSLCQVRHQLDASWCRLPCGAVVTGRPVPCAANNAPRCVVTASGQSAAAPAVCPASLCASETFWGSNRQRPAERPVAPARWGPPVGSLQHRSSTGERAARPDPRRPTPPHPSASVGGSLPSNLRDERDGIALEIGFEPGRLRQPAWTRASQET